MKSLEIANEKKTNQKAYSYQWRQFSINKPEVEVICKVVIQILAASTYM